MALKKANQTRTCETHEALKQQKHTSAAGFSHFPLRAWASAAQATEDVSPRQQYPHTIPPAPCSHSQFTCLLHCTLPSNCRNTGSISRGGKKRREGQIYTSEIFLNGVKEWRPWEIDGCDRWFRSAAICHINSHPFLLKDETAEGNTVHLCSHLSCTWKTPEASHRLTTHLPSNLSFCVCQTHDKRTAVPTWNDDDASLLQVTDRLKWNNVLDKFLSFGLFPNLVPIQYKD